MLMSSQAFSRNKDFQTLQKHDKHDMCSTLSQADFSRVRDWKIRAIKRIRRRIRNILLYSTRSCGFPAKAYLGFDSTINMSVKLHVALNAIPVLWNSWKTVPGKTNNRILTFGEANPQIEDQRLGTRACLHRGAFPILHEERGNKFSRNDNDIESDYRISISKSRIWCWWDQFHSDEHFFAIPSK